MKRITRLAAATIGAATLAAAAVIAVVAPSGAATPDPLAELKDATAAYHSIATAEGHGYGLLRDLKGVACISMPGMGAMGAHWAKPALVGDGKITLRTPEAMVYAPSSDGTLRLAAVEYVVFKKDWDATHNQRPRLFGHVFNLTYKGNRFGLPTYYSLHVWAWKSNPAGMFAPWNPDVHCN